MDSTTHIRSQRLPARWLLLRVLGVLVRGAEVDLAGVHRVALRRGASHGREEGRCDGDDGAMGTYHFLAGWRSSVLSCGAATLCAPAEAVDGVCSNPVLSCR